MANMNFKSASAVVKTKGPTGTKGNVTTSGKTAPIKVKSYGMKKGK